MRFPRSAAEDRVRLSSWRVSDEFGFSNRGVSDLAPDATREPSGGGWAGRLVAGGW